MIPSKKRIIKALIRLCGCARLAASLLFPNPEDRFSRRGPISCDLNEPEVDLGEMGFLFCVLLFHQIAFRGGLTSPNLPFSYQFYE